MTVPKSYCIRPMDQEDLPMVLRWRNHPAVRQFTFTQHEIHWDEHRRWFERACQDLSRHLLIVESAGLPIGQVQFNQVTQGGISEWGFYKAPDAPKGEGRLLGLSALSYAFETLKLHKVCGQILETNHLSIDFHKRFGFIQEGILREQCCINQVYYSVICFGLLAREWQPERIFKGGGNAGN